SRTVEAAVVAAEWGADGEVTLRELVSMAPDGPWSDILAAHLAAMTELTNQIRELRDLNEHYLRSAIRFVQESQVDSTERGTYDSRGDSDAGGGPARIFDVTL
ncbi:MAG: FlgN family protein, partial [Microbacteriaceae bacterium]|nr:FlgN family protein [Microbacteriaceae bacterium]